VVGFVRGAAPALSERGITIDAVCPGFADTPLVTDELRRTLATVGFPLLTTDEVADAVWRLLTTEGTGRALVVQPGREPVEFRFPNVPGARTDEGDAMAAPPAPERR
jgi:NAD(P)-dependent dehydrogenase (short-subunit alcohol dehydrogenase family)